MGQEARGNGGYAVRDHTHEQEIDLSVSAPEWQPGPRVKYGFHLQLITVASSSVSQDLPGGRRGVEGGGGGGAMFKGVREGWR